MAQVKILVVEDEIIIADQICDSLSDFGYETLEPAISYSEAIETIEAEKPDIAILDIQLSGKKSGIDLAKKINADYGFPFIFLTSNSDKVTLSQAKESEPFAFLVKPYSQDELYASIEVALYNYSKQKEKAIDQTNLVIKNALFIKQDRFFIRLNFTDILYIKSDHIYIEIYIKDGTRHIVRGSLNDYMSKLSETFIRSHRSYIINLDHLSAINHNCVIINEQEIPLAKTHRDDLMAKVNT